MFSFFSLLQASSVYRDSLELLLGHSLRYRQLTICRPLAYTLSSRLDTLGLSFSLSRLRWIPLRILLAPRSPLALALLLRLAYYTIVLRGIYEKHHRSYIREVISTGRTTYILLLFFTISIFYL